MLTKVMAKALAPEIAVNAVAPGMIDLGEKAAAPFMRRMAKQTPMQRNGSGDEIAAAVLFFATAPQFITGQILAVDGGLGLVAGKHHASAEVGSIIRFTSETRFARKARPVLHVPAPSLRWARYRRNRFCPG